MLSNNSLGIFLENPISASEGVTFNNQRLRLKIKHSSIRESHFINKKINPLPIEPIGK